MNTSVERAYAVMAKARSDYRLAKAKGADADTISNLRDAYLSAAAAGSGSVLGEPYAEADALRDENARLRMEVTRLRDALHPFAAAGNALPDETPDGAYLHETNAVHSVTAGMLKNAGGAMAKDAPNA